MQKIICIFLAFLPLFAVSQPKQSEVSRILNTLASDSMKGREAGTPSADQASAFIASEFRKAGLKTMDNAADYFQPFNMTRSETLESSVVYDSTTADPGDVLVFAEKEGFGRTLNLFATQKIRFLCRPIQRN